MLDHLRKNAAVLLDCLSIELVFEKLPVVVVSLEKILIANFSISNGLA